MFVSRDVMDGNNVFIPRGATAYLTAKEVKKATFFGIGGKMTLSGGQVFDINDQPHSIKYYNKYEGEDREWATALGIVGCVFWFLLPFAFVKGEEAELHAGQEVVTTLGENVELQFLYKQLYFVKFCKKLDYIKKITYNKNVKLNK